MNEATLATKKEAKLAKKSNPLVDEAVATLRLEGLDVELTAKERETIISDLRASLTPRFKEIEDRLSIVENTKKKS